MSADDIFRAARQYFSYLNQDEEWVPNGKPPVRIADMDPSWRYNAARFLARNADTYLFRYDLGELSAVFGDPLSPSQGSMAMEAMEEEMDLAQTIRHHDPEAWIKSTPLYQALVKDLPDDAAELAKHWSDCAIREDGGACTCWERHVTECPKREDINEACRCRDYSPEWTR
jgi:hypothetical protein